ncbi:MAG: Ni/Fe hydrogenase subunit alpha [Nitrospirae bacterium]|nr:Ni/Fe hydrogenase subunit alpha [Nitrospirota bacterium]
MKINIDYIARVEGEGSVKFEIKDGGLRNLKLNIWEPPRFFEGFLVGRKYDEVPDIVSRICGICPVSHMTTSINSLENAMGFNPSQEIKKIRKIMALSQIAASHIVHLYVLALPDYREKDMVVGLNREITRLVKLKEAVNNVTGRIGGRPLHPVSMIAGGFTKVPSRDEVGRVVKQLKRVRADALQTVKMIAKLDYPDLKTNVEFLALKSENNYAINEGTIITGSGLKAGLEEYHRYFSEKEVPYANAKRTVLKGKNPVMVGALARLHIKFDELHPEARKAADMIGFKTGDVNPYHNNIAQAIEIVHCIWECIELLETISHKDTFMTIDVKEGYGSAITEAPRGLLLHEYELNRMGVVKKANIVTPTAYNFLSIEESLKKLVQENIDKPENKLKLLCEMLVRAYDPCFSCSVH